MSGQDIADILVWAMIAAALIAVPLSMVPALQADRKTFSDRFAYAFANWGVPTWCGIELLFWLMTHRWVPWTA